MAVKALIFDVIGRDKASQTFDRIDKASGRASRGMVRLQKAGDVAGRVLAVGLAAAGVAAVKFANAAAQDDLGQRKLALSLHNAAKATDSQVASVESWISAQGRALGVSDDELRPALSRLAVATHSVSKAQAAASLAMDVAAGTGKSLKSVTEALAKGYSGSTAGLSRLGIATKNADGSTKSLKDITAELGKVYSGAAAKAADSVAGKQAVLKVRMDELQESIGVRLLPVLDKLVTGGMKVIDWIDRNQTSAGILLATIGGLTAAVYLVSAATKVWGAATSVATAAQAAYTAVVGISTTTLGTWVGVKATELGAWLSSTAAVVGSTAAMAAHTAVSLAAAAATKVMAAGQWLLNAAMAANPVGIVVLAIAGLVAGLVLAYKHSETFRSAVDAMGAALKPLAAFIGKVLLTYLKTAAKAWLLMGRVGVMAFTFLLKAAFATFDGILTAAEKGLGWVPKLGPKIRSARAAFNDFGDATIAKLNAVSAKLREASAKVDELGRKHPVINVTVAYHHQGTTNVQDPNGDIIGGPGHLRSTSPRLSTPSLSASPRATSASGDLGTVTLVLASEDGKEIQRKLLKLKRQNGNLSLGLA